jgi:hypothetical protein
VAGLMLGNAVILAWLGWLAGQEPPRALRWALLYVFLNLILSITDEVGPLDIFSLAYSLVLFAICLRLYLLTNRRTA